MAFLKIEGISKTFREPVNLRERLCGLKRENPVLREISFEVEKGELLVILGSTGCGKSTLLNIICGLIPQDSGHLYLDGECIDNLPPNKREVCLVFQDFSLFPHLNVADNIAYGLLTRKIKKEIIVERVKEILKKLDLYQVRYRKPETLSGGEKQRVALARALVVQPKLLLFDEPLSNLDVNVRKSVRSEILRIQKEYDLTTIYVTHDQYEARALANRVAIIHEGKIEQIGKPEDIFYKPETEFVASFTEAENILEGRVLENRPHEGLSEVIVGDVRISTPFDSNLQINQEVKLMVRPEDIIIAKTKPVTSARNVLEGKVSNISHHGSLFKLEINVNGVPVKCLISRISLEEFGISQGSNLYVVFKSSAVHIIK
ncbi:MAG: ABC transporter ATP-binding protein [Candidatus Jordarchaeum sp.]|uniref:ABC transporter ATP-binding protein n=1 Tax=Candidatus Jordarchaeum sp. TaxID=2823881 RepID=UPI0040497681